MIKIRNLILITTFQLNLWGGQLEVQLFLSVCQFVSWLTLLLKLGKYRDISCSWWDIFLIFFETLMILLYTISKCLHTSCMYVSPLVGLLTDWNEANIGISPVLDEIFFWNFSETFLGCWHTKSKYFLHSCMSCSLLIGLLPCWT